MKKIISSGIPTLLFFSFWSVLFFACSLLFLFLGLFGMGEEKGAGMLWFCIFLCLLIVFLFGLNRISCIVWVEDGIVKRKGLICGFYKECPIAHIRQVKTAYHRGVFGGGNYICLVDDSKHQFNADRKDRYICFKKTKKNLLFLRVFWCWPIDE